IVINAAVSLGPATLPSGTAGTAYSQTITASNGTGNKSVSYSLTGTLPAGLNFSTPSPATNSFTISGTPTAAGTVNIQVTATDTVGAQATLSYTLTIKAGTATHFTVSAPGSATQGQSFSFAVTALDAFNNTATGYAGTVHFTSTDPLATLPANATLSNGAG